MHNLFVVVKIIKYLDVFTMCYISVVITFKETQIALLDKKWHRTLNPCFAWFTCIRLKCFIIVQDFQIYIFILITEYIPILVPLCINHALVKLGYLCHDSKLTLKSQWPHLTIYFLFMLTVLSRSAAGSLPHNLLSTWTDGESNILLLHY